MLREYELRDPVLQRIARIVDEADVVQEAQLEPTAPGLDLLCRGLRRISSDDSTALHHGLLLYDALYAWARYVRDETHTWNPQRTPAGAAR